MQESAEDNPGRCFAVEAGPGEVVIVPPRWAHATISADSNIPLTFGAWCDREYGFEYEKVRAHAGMAYYPILKTDHTIEWNRNLNYGESDLMIKKPEKYTRVNIKPGVPVYTQFVQDPAKFQFVSMPYLLNDWWKEFIP